MNKKHILLLCLTFFSLSLFAQKKAKRFIKDKPIYETLDFVYMNDGSYLKGQIVSQTPEVLTFLMLGDNQVEIRMDLIKRIAPGFEGNYYLYRGQSVKKEGNYFSLDIGTSWSQSRWSIAEVSGFHLSTSFGKMLNETFAVGIGTGINMYGGTNRQTYTFVPLYAEVRGYHFKKRISPYYNLGIGIGFAADLVGEFNQNEYYKSGLLIKPALGLRIATKRKLNYYLEMGYRFQKTKTHYQDWRFIPSTGDFAFDLVDEKITFQRLTYSVGMLF